MDCFGSIRSPSSLEMCQPLHVDTDIVYMIEEQRFPGLGQDYYIHEPCLSICPEYLAAQRLKHGTQPLTAHPGTKNQPIDEAHRELYSLIDGLDLNLLDVLPQEHDQFEETLLEITRVVEEGPTGGQRSFLSCVESTNNTPDNDVFQCGPTDNDNVQTSFTVPLSDSSCCTSKPQREPTTNQTSRTSGCYAETMSKPQKKRRYSSVSQDLSHFTYSCIKRRKLSSYDNRAAHDWTEFSDFTAPFALSSPFGVFSPSYSGHSPLRSTNLRQW